MTRNLTLSIVLVGLVGLIGGCAPSAAVSSTPVATATPAAPANATAKASTSVPAAGTSGTADAALLLRVNVGSPSEGLLAVSVDTGAVLSRLPVGAVAADWSVVYAAQETGGRTLVQAFDTRTGGELRRTTLDGSWALPVVVPGALPDGLSADGRALVLVDPHPAPGTSRFALLDTAGTAAPRTFELKGSFEFDAVGPNGWTTYLIERLGSGHYQVRAFDTINGQLVDGVIVDKREIGELMEGRPVARTSSVDGIWVYTLYLREDGTAFVHELDTANRVALCADLPESARAKSAADADAWRIAMGGAATPYAANGRLGLLARVDQGEVTKITDIAHWSASEPVSLVAGGSAAFLAGPNGISLLDGGALAVRSQVRADPLAGVAASPDGRWLFVAGDTSSAGLKRFEVKGDRLVGPEVFSLAEPIAPGTVQILAVAGSR